MKKFAALIGASLALAADTSAFAQGFDRKTVGEILKPENITANEKLPKGCKRVFEKEETGHMIVSGPDGPAV